MSEIDELKEDLSACRAARRRAEQDAKIAIERVEKAERGWEALNKTLGGVVGDYEEESKRLRDRAEKAEKYAKTLQDDCAEMSVEAIDRNARIAELEAALRPFAHVGRFVHPECENYDENRMFSSVYLTCGMFARARAALGEKVET